MQRLTTYKLQIAGLLLALTGLTIGLYYQGLNGPFIFDDHGNIQDNSQIRLTKLNLGNLSQAALSGHAGPLKRPVAMLSFALNYYFAGGYHYFAFKVTNVIIQALCACVLFYFCLQLLRLASLQKTLKLQHKQLPLIAFSIAALWAAHPVNLTSVLYVVQRMTSLSTLFSLACLIFYINARTGAINSTITKRIALYYVTLICFLLAIFSKENALLIPAYIMLIEWTFFEHKSPWHNFKKLKPRYRITLYALLSISCLTLFIYTLDYASHGYGSRTFTLTERVLTEARVICFYLSLITVPRINAFGLFHDDIALSSSLIDPLSTLVSIVVIIALIVVSIRLRKNQPLVCFGVLFFFAGHLLESTVFALEIAHEHRNHLPSVGILIAICGLFLHHNPFKAKAYISTFCLLLFIYGATTLIRSFEWQDSFHLAQYESLHHPKSPATLALLSNTAYKHGQYDIAEQSINQARTLKPTESAYAINSITLAVLLNKPIDSELAKEVEHKLTTNPFSTSTQIALGHISAHLKNPAFKPLQPYFVSWLEIVVPTLGSTRQASFYNYLLAKAYLETGNILGAINAFQRSFNIDKKFINPLFEMGNIFLALEQTQGARHVLQQIKDATRTPEFTEKYGWHIQELENAIISIESKTQLKALK